MLWVALWGCVEWEAVWTGNCKEAVEGRWVMVKADDRVGGGRGRICLDRGCKGFGSCTIMGMLFGLEVRVRGVAK